MSAQTPMQRDNVTARRPSGRAVVQGFSAVSLSVPAAAIGGAWLVPGEAGQGAVAAALLMAGGGVVVVSALAKDYPHGSFGLCNLITLLRATVVAALSALVFAPGILMRDPQLAWTVFTLAAAVLALDGLDGWAARRSGLVSSFGARFDMEVDVALALLLAILAWQSGKAGAWVLALGSLRHAFVAAGWIWPVLRAPLPDALWRKLACVIQIAALVVLLAPVVVPPVSKWVAATALAVLAGSFGRDTVWLLRRR